MIIKVAILWEMAVYAGLKKRHQDKLKRLEESTVKTFKEKV